MLPLETRIVRSALRKPPASSAQHVLPLVERSERLGSCKNDKIATRHHVPCILILFQKLNVCFVFVMNSCT